MLDVNANLFRIAAMAQSDDQMRHYLCGVYVEPHCNGVTMTATDGRYLVSIHDETGTCDKPVIVQLSKDALRACKCSKQEFKHRRVIIGEIPSNQAFVRTAAIKDMAISSDCVVNGTYPDYRRVVGLAMVPPPGKEHCPTFDHSTLGFLCDVAKELSEGKSRGLKYSGLKYRGLKYRGLMIAGALTGGPALVRFTEASHAFGLIMPLKNNGIEPNLPPWFNLTPKPTAQAA